MSSTKRDRPCASSLTALTRWTALPQSKRRTGRWAPGSRARTSGLWVASSSVTSDAPQRPATRYASPTTCSPWRRSTAPGSSGSWHERKLRSAARGGYHHVPTNPEDPTSGSVAPRAGNRGQPRGLRLARRDGGLVGCHGGTRGRQVGPPPYRRHLHGAGSRSLVRPLFRGSPVRVVRNSSKVRTSENTYPPDRAEGEASLRTAPPGRLVSVRIVVGDWGPTSLPRRR